MRMFERDTDRRFPVKRFILLGSLIGAAVYYFSREQNRRALDRKLEELGIKDAAVTVGSAAQDSWQKTREAAHDAADTLKDKAAEAKDKVADVAGDLKDKAKDAAGTVADQAGELKDKVERTPPAT